MNQTELTGRISIMEDNILLREKNKIEKAVTKDYNFVSANLSNFLPELPFEKHESFYLELMQHRSLAVFHSNLTELVNKVKAIGELSFLEQIQSRPFIFCNYHLGSYRALLGFLVSRQIDFAMLLDDRTFKQQGDKIEESIQSLMHYAGKKIMFRMINVEDPVSMMQIGQWLRSGKSLVAYLDGNTGYGGIYNHKEVFLNLQFMGMPIKNRKGISMLSYVSKIPVIPAISYFINKEDAPLLEFFPPIVPDASMEKETYVLNTTQQLYKILETKLRQFPSQWEPWLYIHKFLDMDRLKQRYPENEQQNNYTIEPSAKFSFNKKKYGLFKLDDSTHLFNRLLYTTYEVNQTVFSALSDLYAREKFSLPGADTDEAFIKNLLALEIIQEIK